MMQISVFTYNVLFNTAFLKLSDILKQYSPDIVCLQEIETTEQTLDKLSLYGYRLADYSNSFIKFGKIYGVATFYKQNSVKYLQSSFIKLPRSIYEIVLLLFRGVNKQRTVLQTSFLDLKTNKKIHVFNAHFTAVGTNEARMKQIKKTLLYLPKDPKETVILAGDFNYIPYQRKKLEAIMSTCYLKEATKNIRFTFSKHQLNKKNMNIIERVVLFISSLRFFEKLIWHQYKIDYVFYRGFTSAQAERINVPFSDHFPIFVQFKS